MNQTGGCGMMDDGGRERADNDSSKKIRDVARAKELAGKRAAEFVEDGMTVGLGTGSTAYWVIQSLASRVSQGLRLRGLPTSEQTAQLARKVGIPLVTFADVHSLDLDIDGADEMDDHLQLIKGGGGALMREKLVAVAARKFIVVVDSSKRVSVLGKFPLPVEVVPFAWQTTARRVEHCGCRPHLREQDGTPFVTDNGNYVLDCFCGDIADPMGLHQQLKLLPGVVETGLFVNMATEAVVSDGIKVEVLLPQ